MNYQVTCFCGNSFLITDQQVSSPVTCPQCKRQLLPVISAAGQPDPATTPEPNDVLATPVAGGSPSQTEATKRCPFCGEVILAIAKKCKHCGEFLDRSIPHPAAAAGSTASGAPAPSDNPPVFALSVSQWDNFWKFLICFAILILVAFILIFFQALHPYAPLGVAATFVFMAFLAWLFYLNAKNSRCFIRATRIDTEVGILSKDLNSIELFRITDMELKQSLLERIIGIGTIRITSSDPQTPQLILYQIPQARRVHKYLQDQIPVATKQRGAYFVEK